MLRRKIKQVILGIAAVLILLIVLLVAVIFEIYDDELSFRFLDPYEATRRNSWDAKDYFGEDISYHFRVDYDTFIETAKTELLANGFSDVSDPNHPYKLTYAKYAFGETEVEIRFAIVRNGPAINQPVNFWLDVKIHRIRPKLNIHNSWDFLKIKYARIRYKLKYNQPK